MLKRTPHGIQLFKDWSPSMIGKAIAPKAPAATWDSHRLQLALVGGVKPCVMEPRPVPVLDTVEKLVELLNRPRPAFLNG